MQQVTVNRSTQPQETVRLSVDLSPRIKRAFKMKCTKMGIGMSEQASTLIWNWLKNLEQKPQKH